MTLKELIESVDILAYISQYTEFTEKNGEYWALSPLKEEQTPSFSVNTELASFYDFSSGCGGNLLQFIKDYNHCDVRKAEQILREYSGCTDFSPQTNRMEATRVAKRYAKGKKQTRVSNSVVLPDDYMERYEKKDEKLSAWETEGISRASLDKFQVYYDGFSDRLVYPIRNLEGKIVNVSGRTLDKDLRCQASLRAGNNRHIT